MHAAGRIAIYTLGEILLVCISVFGWELCLVLVVVLYKDGVVVGVLQR